MTKKSLDCIVDFVLTLKITVDQFNLKRIEETICQQGNFVNHFLV